jgi:hypothetical protein
MTKDRLLIYDNLGHLKSLLRHRSVPQMLCPSVNLALGLSRELTFAIPTLGFKYCEKEPYRH